MATMHDVAKEARVSIASVSAVVNGKDGIVGLDTQQRIMTAITKIGYRPNRTARQLKTGTFDTIALVMKSPIQHSVSKPDFVMVIVGVSDSAAEAGLNVLLSTATQKRSFTEIVDDLESQGVDGAIILGPISLKKDLLRTIENCPIPLVCVESYRGFSKASCLDNDNIAGMRMAVEHLIASGHNRIAYIGHPPIYQCFLDRMQAFCEVMQENDLPVGETSIRIIDGEHVESCVEEMISKPDRPTAIVIGEEAQGVSAWNALMAAGLEVPKDISLVVYDKLPENHPGRDVVLQINSEDYYMLGQAATELLVNIISGETATPANVRIQPQLTTVPCPVPILRASSQTP